MKSVSCQQNEQLLVIVVVPGDSGSTAYCLPVDMEALGIVEALAAFQFLQL
jgi:hypothetical protein